MDSSIERFPKQYPIGCARDIDVNVTDKSVMLKWTDPDDPIINNVYFSKWECTKIIRKKDTPPENIWDGETIAEITEHNKYKDEYFVDEDITTGDTYYYAIVPCSDLGMHYWEKVDMLKLTPIKYDPILENNTWDTIVTVANNRCTGKAWKIGDTKVLKLGGVINKDIVIRISNITVIPANMYDKNMQSKNITSFDTVELLNNTAADIAEAIPTEIKDLLGEQEYVYSKDDMSYIINMHNSPIYTDNNSRIKTLNGVPTKYNCGEALIDETGKVYESTGTITDVQVLNIII